MERENILKIVEKIFREVIGDDKIIITEDTVISGSIGEDILMISSIDFVQAIVEIEEYFNIVIDFDFPIKTVADVINVVQFESKRRDKDNANIIK